LQNTASQLGAAIGTALVGSIVLCGLAASLGTSIAADDRVSEPLRQQVGIVLEAGVSFVTTDQVSTALDTADVPSEESEVLIDLYAGAQLRALKTGLLVAALLVLASFAFTTHLPSEPLDGPDDDDDDDAADADADS